MEHRKAEILSRFEHLKQECELTVALLNEILQKNHLHMKNIRNLSLQDMRQQSKYFLGVSHFHHESYQKILELNVHLDEFLLNKEYSPLQETATYLESAFSSTLDTESISSHLVTDTTLRLSCENLKLEEVERGLEVTQDVEPRLQVAIVVEPPVEEAQEIESPIEITEAPKINAPSTACSVISNEKVLNQTPSDYFYSANADTLDNKSSLSEMDFCSGVSSQKPNNDIKYCTSEMMECCSNVSTRKEVKHSEDTKMNSISEKLKALPIMTLEEKCQPTSFMPDVRVKQTGLKYSDVGHVSTPKFTPTKDNSVPKKAVDVVAERIQLTIESRAAPVISNLCMIGCIESPSQFYIQVIDDNSSLLDVITLQLKEMYNDSKTSDMTKRQAKDKLGTFCAADIDNYWYRIQVLDWMLTDKDQQTTDVRVQLVDYGNKYVVSYKNLKPLTPILCNIPKMAQLCHLPYIYPVGSTQEERLAWPNDTINIFEDICGVLDESIFTIKFVAYSSERDSYEVDLTHSEHNSRTIGEALIESGLAIEIIDKSSEVIQNSFMMNQIQTAHGINGINVNMSQEEVLNTFFEQAEITEANTVSEAVMSYDPRDEAETCRNLRPDGTCYKGKNCKLRHARLTEGFTRDRQLVYTDPLVQPYEPDIGEEVCLTISHVINVQTFFGQIRPFDVIMRNLSLSQLVRDMNTPEVIKNYKKFRCPPSITELVVAQHWNTYWYRAKVIDIDNFTDNNTIRAEVFFVDFGDTSNVPMSKLRLMEPQFLNIAYQATECRLYNVKNKTGVDPEEGKMLMESSYLGQTYTAKIIANPGHLQVLLMNSKGDDIGMQLIQDGVAEFNSEHIFPSARDIILID